MKRNILILFLNLTLMTTIFSCRTIPKGAEAVKNFDKSKYLGKWYEIARLDFKFEKDLNNTTALYSLNSNKTVRVENKGYNYKKDQWKKAIGKAKFVGSEDVAKLKVSFWGPFYSGYNVVAIDSEYNYALVMGKNLKYLWILSRNKSIPDDIKNNYMKIAQKIGYDTDKLIWVEHNK